MADDQGLGNFKGVMLCNRPGVAEASVPQKPFLSRVAVKGQLGIAPAKEEEEVKPKIGQVVTSCEAEQITDSEAVKAKAAANTKSKADADGQKRLNWEIKKKNSEWLQELVKKSKEEAEAEEKKRTDKEEREKRLKVLSYACLSV